MNTSSDGFRVKNGSNYIIKFTVYTTDAGYRGDKPSNHSQPEIIYYIRGSGKFKINNNVYEFKAGDLFFIPPYTTHRAIDRYEVTEHINLWFVPDSLNIGHDKNNINFNDIFSKVDVDDKIHIKEADFMYENIRRTVLDIHDEVKSKRTGYVEMIRIKLSELTMQLVRRFEYTLGNVNIPRDLRVEAIDNTLEYISASLGKTFTLDELAKVANMSPKHYGAVFKEINGITPWEYITSKKMELAKNLLADRSKSIMEVAYECGYANIANFNRAFKKCTRQTPSEYRKQL